MKNFMIDLASVLSTLREVGGGPVPASMIYLGLGSSMGRYQAVADVLSEAGLAIVTSETIQLTEAGFAKAKAVDALIGR